ncbi:hypothetical protein ACTA71_005525 [Dictyostelium dimigraforme]
MDSNFKCLNTNHLGSNILVTGQFGLILEIIKWIIKFSGNVKNIIIFSKSSMKWRLELSIKKNKHINFHFKSIDIGDSNQVDKPINEILSNENQSTTTTTTTNTMAITNINSIIHFAVDYATFCGVNEIDINGLDVLHGAKTMGAINLHGQSIKRNWNLKQFILSSVSSMIGSTDQCTYVCLNRVLDSLYRKSIGLTSICTNYGSIQSVGLVSLSINMILGTLYLRIQLY